MPTPARYFTFVMLLLAGVGARAASLGEAAPASHLGEPLRLAIPVSLDEGSLLVGNCVRLVGPARWHPVLRGAVIGTVTRSGRQFITLTTAKPVLDPVLDMTLRLEGCGTTLEKNYLVLLSPVGVAGAPSAAALAAFQPAPVESAAEPAPAARATTPSEATAARKPAVQTKPRPDRPTAAAPVASPPSPVAMAEPPAPTPPTPVEPPATQVKAPEAAPAKSPETAPAGPSWIAYAVLLLVLAVLVTLILIQYQRMRRPPRPSARGLATIKTGSRAASTAESGSPSRMLRALMPGRTVPADTTRTLPMVVGHGSDGIVAKTLHPGDLSAEPPDALDHVMELAEVMLAFGRSHQAIDTLTQHIRANPRQAVEPWLKLLDLYHQCNLRDEFDTLAAELHTHYNVAIPVWTDQAEAPSSQFPTLESLPHIMTRLTEHWGSRAGLDYLDTLLADNRNGQRRGFDMALVKDIVMLRGILRQTSQGT